ncbi:L-histidine N(alpha)-methyltransferase [Oligoflexus tunisiensis]|uniref:L-histidine N(alpha)-methyltransferase n=1 Tax=Oligoflexus tunisiensis TaxID=708132 RepID=UPI000A5A4AD8|nr:L-histidine N(alpha)-methyltransferase [Oligoflexus tunisiensis]
MNPSNLIGEYDLSIGLDNFRQDVLHGLTKLPKTLPPKYFYDARGSRLFDFICETPEYYLTRKEISILEKYGSQILEQIPHPIRIIELGSGSSIKTRLLLDAASAVTAYIPIDISKEHLLRSTHALAQRFPHIPMVPVCADYTRQPALPLFDRGRRDRSLVFFPGSTLGNLDEDEALALLQSIRHMLRGDGYFLVGIDLLKDPKIMEAAYNDAERVTAAFNLNLLHRINVELDADFKLNEFQHKAVFNAREKRMEMHLRSVRHQVVWIKDVPIPFGKDETIHTESSYKYDLHEFAAFCRKAGFQSVRSWTDAEHYFAVVLLQTTPAKPNHRYIKPRLSLGGE